ncbi:MAG: queuosine precursor transporter, partial [Bdellovibrionia bacterium]
IDVVVFWFFRNKTGGRLLWLRATGSTAISQLVDTFVIIGIAFWLPGKVSTADFLTVASTNYSYKLLIAVALTPGIYLAHNLIDRFLGNYEAHRLMDQAAQHQRM